MIWYLRWIELGLSRWRVRSLSLIGEAGREENKLRAG